MIKKVKMKNNNNKNNNKNNSKKGQAALEFLTTYGWGFMVILITIGALSYFGFFSPEKYVPEKCYFGNQLVCEDFFVQGTTISLYLRNDLGKPIKIIAASVKDQPGTELNNGNEKIIDSGAMQEIKINNVYTGVTGDKNKFVILLNFSKNESTLGPSFTPPVHTITGLLDASIN